MIQISKADQARTSQISQWRTPKSTISKRVVQAEAM